MVSPIMRHLSNKGQAADTRDPEGVSTAGHQVQEPHVETMVLSFHLHETPRKGKCIEGSRAEGEKGGGRKWEQEVLKLDRGLPTSESLLKIIEVCVLFYFIFFSVYFKQVNVMVCKLYHNKAVKKERKISQQCSMLQRHGRVE